MNSLAPISPEHRARKIVRTLLEAFINREGVFSDTKELLENQIPPGVRPLSREHANFLFFLISQDHGTKSARLYERAKALYKSGPQYFDPAFVSSHSDPNGDDLKSFIAALGVRYPQVARKGWMQNATRLHGQFSADARLLFRAHSTPAQTIALIRSFYGFGPKISGLLFRVFVGTGLAAFSDTEGVEFPTDIHDARIAALTSVADIPTDITEASYGRHVRLAQEAWRRACHDERVSWLQVDRALWILGSKGCITDRHADCPLRTFCQRGDTDTGSR